MTIYQGQLIGLIIGFVVGIFGQEEYMGINVELDFSSLDPYCEQFGDDVIEVGEQIPSLEDTDLEFDLDTFQCNQTLADFFPEDLKKLADRINKVGVNSEKMLDDILKEGCLPTVFAEGREQDSAIGQIEILVDGTSQNKSCTGVILSPDTVVTAKECFFKHAQYRFRSRIFLKQANAWIDANATDEGRVTVLKLAQKLQGIQSLNLNPFGDVTVKTICNVTVQGYSSVGNRYASTNCPFINNFQGSLLEGYDMCNSTYCSTAELDPGSPLLISCKPNINKFFVIGLMYKQHGRGIIFNSQDYRTLRKYAPSYP